MFIAALYTITQKWKQYKFPSTDEWITNVMYTYNRISFKRNRSTAIYMS